MSNQNAFNDTRHPKKESSNIVLFIKDADLNSAIEDARHKLKLKDKYLATERLLRDGIKHNIECVA